MSSYNLVVGEPLSRSPQRSQSNSEAPLMSVEMDTTSRTIHEISATHASTRASTSTSASANTNTLVDTSNTNTNMNADNNNTNMIDNNNSNNKMRRALRKRHQRRAAGGGRKPGSGAAGRVGGRRQRRHWQLPESSIDEYTKWIQEKPEDDQTPNEQRFLWKSMIRSLGVVNNNNNNNNTGNSNSNININCNSNNTTEKNGRRIRQERIREFVERLQAKQPYEQLTATEEQFVRLYHRRRKDRKAQRQQQKQEKKQQQQQQQQQQLDDNDEPIVSWMRNVESSGNSENINSNRKTITTGLEPLASLDSLRESMKKMGLSSDKLKQVRFADQQMMEQHEG